jgi:hypothetical protein
LLPRETAYATPEFDPIASACNALDKLIESGNDEAFSKFVHLYVPVNHHDHAGTDV